ncbi:MAG: hypothetical protein HQL74_07435 [Magnetococcales bacterium]|nr:hypothetical protein [Magnetococcales bacterium]
MKKGFKRDPNFKSLYVRLSVQDHQAFVQLAEKNFRDPSAELAMLVVNHLQSNAGTLPSVQPPSVQV